MTPRPAITAIAAAILSTLAIATAHADHFRRPYYSRSYVKVIREQPIIVDQPDVFVVQNNLPSTITAQGDTVYRSGVAINGYQQTAIPLFNPQSYFAQSLELVKAANQTAALQSQRTDALVDRVLSAQAATVETLARGEAAARVLQAAGIATVGQPQAQSLGVVITRDQGGRLQVLQLSPEAAETYAATQSTQSVTQSTPLLTQSTQSVTQSTPLLTQSTPLLTQSTQAVTQSTQAAEGYQGQAADAPSTPLLTRFCAACHGPELAAPRGSLYIDSRPQSRRVIAQELGVIRDRLLSDMPPAGSPQPSQAERQAMLAELQLLSQ